MNLFINLILLICNIFILIRKNKILINTKILFKSSDNFILNLLNLTYKDISNYLNYKYIINKSLSKNFEIPKNKKIIKFHCVDVFAENQFKIWIKEKLENKFIIKYDKKNPDYLMYNIGKNHLNSLYKNTIKIAIYTENKIPDFNESDYLIGHPHINYLDRYFKFSMFLFGNFTSLTNLREKILNTPKRNKFCCAVISHPKKIDGFRINFINELNKYKRVDMGGLYKNNVGKELRIKLNFYLSINFQLQWKIVWLMAI